MRRPLLAFALMLAVAGASFPAPGPAPAAVQGPEPCPGRDWERVGAAEAGFDPARLAAAQRFADAMESTGGLVAYDGRVLMTWGAVDRKGEVHSIRKSFLSALVGIHARAGAIDLGATLERLGIDDRGGLTPAERQATVRDLLMARSGVYHGAAYETAGMQQARPPRGSAGPGARWYYNNWDFNALGAIFERAAGCRIADAFQREIAAPLGMQDFTPADVRYLRDPVSDYPAYPFRMTVRDMARFGLLYLRDGRWAGRQVVPRDWVRESTTGYSAAGPGVAYGYLWWVAAGHLLGNPYPGRAFRADGHGGQMIIVLPELRLVIAHLSRFDQTRRSGARAVGQLLKLLLAARVQ